AAALRSSTPTGLSSYASTVPKKPSSLNPFARRSGSGREWGATLPRQARQARSVAWDFEIHADTQEDEITNLMEHSTSILDISDDGDRERRRAARGKENIPPSPDGETHDGVDDDVEDATAGGRRREQSRTATVAVTTTDRQTYTGPVTRSRAIAGGDGSKRKRQDDEQPSEDERDRNIVMRDRSRVALAELDPREYASKEHVQSDAEHAAHEDDTIVEEAEEEEEEGDDDGPASLVDPDCMMRGI
ncbi:hypothetical protein KEM52_003710, partial [Ascosphaera acerosa]